MEVLVGLSGVVRRRLLFPFYPWQNGSGPLVSLDRWPDSMRGKGGS